MAKVAVALQHVSKKFRKGQMHDTLRELLPAIAKKLFRVDGSHDGPASRDFWALRDVTVDVPHGEAFGIIGHNGAGKSTILKLLCGIMKPTQGTIEVDGKLSALIEVGAGFHPDLTGRENIYLSGTILGMSKQAIRDRFDEIVEFSELADFLDTPVKRYSSGMYARLGFSVAAHVNPDVLVVDEVLSVGDYAFQNKCFRKMQSILRQGCTVLFVSHNLKAVAELCTRAMLLHKGAVARIAPTNDVIKDYLDAHAARTVEKSDKEIVISSVRTRTQHDDRVHFVTGDLVHVDVCATARVDVQHVSIGIGIFDEEQFSIFNTSTERLTHQSVSLRRGQSVNCTVDLCLHLAPGKYHLAVWLYRYDIQAEYDGLAPAATFFVTADYDIRGIANLYPKVTSLAIKNP